MASCHTRAKCEIFFKYLQNVCFRYKEFLGNEAIFVRVIGEVRSRQTEDPFYFSFLFHRILIGCRTEMLFRSKFK